MVSTVSPRNPCSRFRHGAAGLLALSLYLGPSAAQADAPRQVAVVIGISRYAHLPDDLDLDYARSDARDLARLLEDEAGYDEVHLLLDGVATRDAVESLFLETLPEQLDADDTLLVYFVGHGVGGDFDDPYLLPYDVNPDRLQETAISIDTFGTRARQVLDVGALVIITDAAHEGLVNGLALLGPGAKSWPRISDNYFTLSACSPGEIPTDNPFGKHLADALRGAADISGDQKVSASELHRYVLDRTLTDTRDQVHPSEAGTYDPGLVVSTPTQTAAATATAPSSGDDGASAGKGRRVAGFAGLGAAALLGGGSAYAYIKGREYNDYKEGYVKPPAGTDPGDWADDYEQAYTLNWVLGASAGVAAVAGSALLLIPASDGVALTWHTRF